MLNTIVLKNIKKVYYHGKCPDCPDGLASAIIISAALQNPKIQYIPLFYNSHFYKNLNPELYTLFCDITPHKDTAALWVPYNPIVLDHHATQKEIVESFKYGIYKTNSAHSGARLAFEEVYCQTKKNSFFNNFYDQFSNLAMIADTWKKMDREFDKSRYQAHGLSFYGADLLLNQTEQSFTELYPELLKVGEISFNNVMGGVREKADRIKYSYHTIRAKSGHYEPIRIALCNSAKNVSELGDYVRDNENVDLFVAWFLETVDDKTVVEIGLRSNNRISCAELAKQLNGGGHFNAAGCRIEGAEFLSQTNILKKIVDAINVSLAIV